jgi:superoxide dismutase
MEGLDRHIQSEHDGIEKIIPTSIKKKRKLIELQQKYNDQLSDDSESDIMLEHHHHHQKDMISKLTTFTKRQKQQEQQEPISIQVQYKIAKQKLKYILRENEMLCDEWTTTEKKLKRLRTERRVLLDALVKRGYNNEKLEE